MTLTLDKSFKQYKGRHSIRVGIKPRFYHKAQPGGFYGFYEGGFLGFYGFYVGFINLKVYH